MGTTEKLVGGAAAGKAYATFDGQAAVSPLPEKYSNASWLSRLVFGYAAPVLAIGQARQLGMDDLWELEGDIRSSVAYTAFKAEYDKYEHSVVRAMLATYGRTILLSGVGSAIMAACAVFAPAVLHHVIDAFAAPTIDLENLTVWVAAFFASRLVNAFLGAHVSFSMEMAMLKLTVSMKALIFEKAMRRSIQSKNDNTIVDVSNLFTADIDNLMWAGYQVNVVWVMPMQVVAVIYMLYNVLDVAAFAGLGIILLSMFLNYLVAKGYSRAFNDVMKYKDTRMKVVKEVFGAIQVIKFNAWESKFLDRIRKWRARELGAITKFMYLHSVSTFLFWGAPLFVSVGSFAMYSFVLGKELTAAKVFTAMVLFAVISEPLSQFAEALQALVQARLAVTRISKYLTADEVSPDRIARETSMYDSDILVFVESATFDWELKSSSVRAMHEDSNGHCNHFEPFKSQLLRNVSFEVRKGDFVVIHGEVGSGKSSLCSAILGELPKQHGKVFVRTSNVAYYSQQPWIQNTTIRDNILFGLPYDKTKYNRVIDACGLVKDIAMFPAGDSTEIGQKGVNLSGGQKARVALARACYSDADLYILDTPLAAVDAVVQSEIFNKCFCGILETKTIILVTHLHEVIDSPAVNVNLKVENNAVVARYKKQTHSRCTYANLQVESAADDSHDTDKTIDHDHKDVIDEDVENGLKAKGALIEEEDREDGRVSSGVFLAYVDAFGGVKVVVGCVFLLACWQGFQSGSDVWLSHWTGSAPSMNPTGSSTQNLTVYMLLALGATIFVFLRALVTAYAGTRAARHLFDEMTKSLLFAPLRFFDANPIGRILNRYAEDTSVVDFRLPFSFFGFLASTTINLFRLLTAIYVIRWMGLLFLPLGWMYVSVGVHYLASSREVSRLMKVSTSPILNHLSESQEGIAVLRAFGQPFVDRAIIENFNRCDTTNRVWYAQTVVNQWFTVRVQLIGFSIAVLIVSTLLMFHKYLSPGLVGLAFMYAVNIDLGLAWWVRSWSGLEMAMVSPERISEYVGIPAEGHPSDRLIVHSGPNNTEWPQSGAITFQDVKFAYKPGGDLVLKGLSFEIKHNEKIGIVGRTGAGKSSLTMAIFRINELVSGRIMLDGVDISAVNLQTLRSSMSIIPQVPVLFKGSLRVYMDPFEEYEDAAIWLAFDKIGMKVTISALDDKLQHELSENGENFSVGERQMLCLARALLRKSRVVVLDEATASIDVKTEQKLQQMIQREFVDATVLTIAHRLATVLDSDRILVLSDGRVAEFDTPRELANRHGGVFHELAKEGGYLEQLL